LPLVALPPSPTPQLPDRRLAVVAGHSDELVEDARLLVPACSDVAEPQGLHKLFHTRPRHRVPFLFGNPTYEEPIPPR